jgi:hypothetical protein
MQATIEQAQPLTLALDKECVCPTCGGTWLLDDLNQVLDYAVQEGNYEEADMIAQLIQEAISWELQAA